MSDLTLGSLFDGSGGFPLGGMLSGITPVWASEIEPFPIRVTTKRLPFMKHYGDISAMDGAEVEPVDIVCFGSPCQDMSVAGRRDGLDGARSSLFYEAVRIIKEMRKATDGRYPKYIVWENVPGAFSSNGGSDFKAVLDALVGIVEENAEVPMPDKNGWPYADVLLGDGWSFAYRVLDAQYFGVPQRRRRIYLVGSLADRSAGDILFKSEGVSRYSPALFRAWQRTACRAEESAGAAGFGVDGYNSTVSDRAATLGVNCGMSTGRNGVAVIDSIGGRSESYSVTEVCGALKASQYKNPPSITDKPSLLFENHGQDTRYTGPCETSQTILSTFGTGGNNQPFVVESPKTLKIRCGKEGGGKGPLVQEDRSATLSCNNDQTLFQPVVFGISSHDSNAMGSANPHSGIYKADTARTLDGNGGNPSCYQGGMAVVEGNGSRPSHKGDGYAESDVMYTFNTIDRHAVAYGIDRAAFNQGQNALFGFAVEKELEPTIVAKGPAAVAAPTYSASKASYFTAVDEELAGALVATDYKDPPLINDTDGADYIVRRLTPTECARLQGFPDWWCSDLAVEEPTTDELRFWLQVFETHSRVTGETKPKTLKQVVRWLREPHTDSAEYKMWGNGVALPCVFFVLSGIAAASEKEAGYVNN